MRSLTALALAAFALGLAPGLASAADIRSCRSDRTTSDAAGYRQVAKTVRKVIAPEVRKYLGGQFAHQWMQPDDAGWYVGVAPGKRSLAQVRTWLAGRVSAHFKGSEAALIRSRMHVIRQPYSYDRLAEAGNRAWEILSQRFDQSWTGGDGCSLSSAWRVEITLYRESNAADLREARALLEELGDVVRVHRVDLPEDNSVD